MSENLSACRAHVCRPRNIFFAARGGGEKDGTFFRRAPCGARQSGTPIAHATTPFQSTHPLRGATRRRSPSPTMRRFQSTHPLRGATCNPVSRWRARRTFQSTHPLRGATLPHSTGSVSVQYFNPRTPCGARLSKVGTEGESKNISIHAPLAGRDPNTTSNTPNVLFQSTRPLRGATASLIYSAVRKSFQSTRPLRGATYEIDGYTDYVAFQSPRPWGGATPAPLLAVSATMSISIHAPLAGRDRAAFARLTVCAYFNPRAPCGVRLDIAEDGRIDQDISIHAPLAGCDQ